MIRLLPLLVALAAAGSPLPALARDGVTLQRFAVIASANDGGPQRTRLRFAGSDASAMARVLENLGGVRREDVVQVTEANRARLRAGFERVGEQLRQAKRVGVRQEIFVYYSGHSDEDGLLLGQERVGYRELRSWIEEMDADVRIAILDSCASGAIIRPKGGVRRPAFLSDASTHARGHAFLTASSANEAAQESDRIGAAFFTHYLVSGLRGAADANRDRRVTLSEAYQFAYAETLRRTETSRIGAQHAAYDIQLAGTGDLVMTDLNVTSSGLVFNKDVAGRLYVRDNAGRLLVELRKEPLYPVEIGLEPGSYRVVLDADGRPFEANVELRQGARRELARSAFTPTASLVAIARGGDPALATSGAPPTEYRHVPIDAVIAPGLRLSGESARPVKHNFVLGVIGHSDALSGAQLSLFGNIVQHRGGGVQATTGANLSYGAFTGAQLSGFLNLVRGPMTGVQASGFVNVARGPITGEQLSIATLSDGPVRGLQAGVGNLLRQDLRGLQIGVGNYTAGHLRGGEVGVVNVAGSLAGAQIGVINVGGSVRGTQIGVVNVASTSHGAQIGVVNVAREASGASFGLLPIVGNGYNRVVAWSSDLSLSNLGFKLGTRHMYVLWGAGITNGDRTIDDTLYSVSFGVGGHLTPFGDRLFLDLDVVGTQMGSSNDWADRNASLGSVRAVVGYQLMRHLAITAGPTYNVQTSWDGEDYQVGHGVLERVVRDGRTTVRMFPGFILGVQI